MHDNRSTMDINKTEENTPLSLKKVPKKLLKLKKVSEMIDMPERTLRDMCLRREVEHVRIGILYYFTPKQIETIIEKRTIAVRGEDRFRRRR